MVEKERVKEKEVLEIRRVKKEVEKEVEKERVEKEPREDRRQKDKEVDIVNICPM